MFFILYTFFSDSVSFLKLKKLGYWLDYPDFESWLGKWVFIFSKTSRLALLPTQPPAQWVPGFFPETKASGLVKNGAKSLLSFYAFTAWTGKTLRLLHS
jgi:hypothetical protein